MARGPRGQDLIKRCAGRKRNGDRCGRFQHGEFCVLHARNGKALAQAMQRKRVDAEAAQVPPVEILTVSLQSPSEILSFTERAVAMQADGRLSGHAGYQIASLLQVAIRAHELIAAGKAKAPPVEEDAPFRPEALRAVAGGAP